MKIYGIAPPMATPFAADESLDENLLRANVKAALGWLLGIGLLSGSEGDEPQAK